MAVDSFAAWRMSVYVHVSDVEYSRKVCFAIHTTEERHLIWSRRYTSSCRPALLAVLCAADRACSKVNTKPPLSKHMYHAKALSGSFQMTNWEHNIWRCPSPLFVLLFLLAVRLQFSLKAFSFCNKSRVVTAAPVYRCLLFIGNGRFEVGKRVTRWRGTFACINLAQGRRSH